MNPKKSKGRPKMKIDWKVVDKLLEADCEGTEIASYIGVDSSTLYHRCESDNKMLFSEYLRQKKAKGNTILKETQFDCAIKDKNIPMQIWLGKQRLGQKEKQDITTDDKPINLPTVIIEHRS